MAASIAWHGFLKVVMVCGTLMRSINILTQTNQLTHTQVIIMLGPQG